MLSRVMATRFDRQVASGRTKPCFIGCTDNAGQELEVVAKFVAGCDRGPEALVAEAVAAMLARDLELPVPEPFLISVDQHFVSVIPDPGAMAIAQASIGLNFGSKRLPAGFSTYPRGLPLTASMIPIATEILAFDTFIDNHDRRMANPNLMIKGKEIAIYDHELSFFTRVIIGWEPPWVPGSIDFSRGLVPDERHIFLDQLRGKPIELDRFVGAFMAVSDERIDEYRSAVPPEWTGDGSFIDHTLLYIAELRDNLDTAVSLLKGALA